MAKIWVDAGHGGSDSGAVNGSRYEKTDALNLAMEVKRQFAQQGQEVVMTRETDVFLELAERTNIENENHCDLSISIHRNSGVSSASGVEIWLHHTAPVAYESWAAEIVNGLSALGFVDRGVKKGYRGDATLDYAVNRDTNSPSMLIEIGFITSDVDNAIFDPNQDKIAAAIVMGCLDFLHLPYTAPEVSAVPAEPDPVSDTSQVDTLTAQLAAVTAQLATVTSERDSALALLSNIKNMIL